MRKSERIRQLELKVQRLEFQNELIVASLNAVIESSTVKPDLDAQKWYVNKLNGNH